MRASVLAAAAVTGPVLASAAEAEETWTPGVLGFLVTFGLVLACIPLLRSMTGKIRGVQHRGAEDADGVGAVAPGEAADADHAASQAAGRPDAADAGRAGAGGPDERAPGA